MKVKSQNEVAQSCLTLSDPMDCSPPSSSIHGIFQARVLEWGAIAFSEVGPRLHLNSSYTLGWEDPLEKEMVMHSSILACEIPWAEKPGGL